MNTQSNGQKTSVMGVVTAAYDPEMRERLKDGATYISPGRIYLDVKGTVCEVSCWSVDSDKVNMPPFWTGIDFDTLEGRTVIISATYDKEYTNPNTNETKHQYKSPTDIQYLDGDAPTPKEATPVPTAPATIAKSPQATNGFVPGPRDAWSAAGQAMGNSTSVVGGFIQTYFAKTGEFPSEDDLLLHAKKVVFGSEALRVARLALAQETDDEAQNPDLESLESF